MSAAGPAAAATPPPAALPADWPNRGHSHEVAAAGLRWHVQLAGRGPLLLLLHGTGGSVHSWAAMLPLLAAHFTVLAVDLPGHGHTTGAAPQDLSLPRMAQALTGLLQALKLPPPQAIVGHSAGAALALRLAIDADQPPRMVIGFAPSLVAPPALYTQWIGPLINPVASSSPVTGLVTSLALRTGLIDRLLASTGSVLQPAQRALYRRLFSDPAHVRGAVGFMAATDLPGLFADCRRLIARSAFVLGQRDRWIPERALRPVIARHLPRAQVEAWPGGHLVHEETPERAAAWVRATLA